MAQIPGKQIQNTTIDSNHYVLGSIDGQHLSSDAMLTVLESKQTAVSKRFASAIASGTSSSLATNALAGRYINSSPSGKILGSSSQDGIVTASPNNINQIRNSANEEIQDGSNNQIYGRVTSSTAAQSGTWTWNGTTTVASDDTSGVVTGDFIAQSATGPFFEITSISANVSVTILNPSSFTIPSGASAYKLTLTLSYFTLPAGVQTAYTFTGSVDILVKYLESTSLYDEPFQPMDEFGSFAEIIDVDVDAAEVSYDPTGNTYALGSEVQTAIDQLDAAIGTVTSNWVVLENITTQTITGTDTPITDNLNFTPVAGTFSLYLNGLVQKYGATFDFTVSGTAITWLASTGTAVDLATTDVMQITYLKA